MSSPYTRFEHLPSDMQTLMIQFLERYDCNWEELPLQSSGLPLISIEVEPLARFVEAFDWDERGQAQVEAFARAMVDQPDTVAPLIVGENASFMDGRHRILAARSLGMTTMTAIDFPTWVAQVLPRPKPRGCSM